MRYIVYGAGAVGCTLGAHLFQQGREVVLVGREQHVNKINQDGLKFTTGDGSWMLNIPAVTTAEALAPFRDDDVVLLCVKSQHTLQCMGQLKRAGASRNLTIVCCQNSIWNEATCARAFHHVYGMTTALPAVYLQPGEVLNPMTGRKGYFDIGRFPGGVDDLAEQLVADFVAADFTAYTHPDIMLAKGAKCLGNLANVVRALLIDANDGENLIEQLREEAKAVWRACGIEWEDLEHYRERVVNDRGVRKIPPEYQDLEFRNSSWQSLKRGAGSIETEQLNGDIVYLGRLVGIETPYNQLVTDLAARMVSEGSQPSRYTEREILAMVE